MALNGKDPKGAERKRPNLIREDRPKPHDLNAEKAVLGAMLIDSPAATDTAIEKLGTARAFYSDSHQKIYDTIIDLHTREAGIDHISVAKSLSDKGILDQVGGDSYLMEMQNMIATTANLETWCQMVHDRAVLRRIIDACAIASEKCFASEKEATEILDEVEKSILEASELGKKLTIFEMKDMLKPTVDYLQKLSRKDEDVVGISTGYADIDDKITGMKPGEMFVIAARPAVGKTSLALSILRNVALRAQHPKSVLMFTMEMTAEQIARRILCAEAGVSERNFRDKTQSKGEWQRITGAATLLSNSRILIDPTPALRVMEMRARARRLKSQNKIDLIVIDYLQLMKADVDRKNDNRQQEVSLISAGIKSLAKELSLPILVLAQLNRATEMQKGGTPKLSNLRESGSIEQDADIVGFIHRDTEKQKDASEEEKIKGLEAEFIIEKNRNGEPGRIPLSFFPLTASFGSRSRYGDDDVPEK
ncbi:MAG: replicative DNA helicase [Lentisphaerae bacterium GWF2_50_93]|nr:MAG: replicative DNA helicase [Lentisphaerae bacterium GWF2_50_93]